MSMEFLKACSDCGAAEGEKHADDCKKLERIRKGFGAVSRVKATGKKPPKKKVPIIDANTMWMQAFFEVARKAQERGDDVVEFSEVDAMVVEWSHQPLNELLEVLTP